MHLHVPLVTPQRVFGSIVKQIVQVISKISSNIVQRTIRYYIGNIGPSSNRAGLLQFLKEHGVVPIGVRMIETHRGHLSAKITVNASDRFCRI